MDDLSAEERRKKIERNPSFECFVQLSRMKYLPRRKRERNAHCCHDNPIISAIFPEPSIFHHAGTSIPLHDPPPTTINIDFSQTLCRQTHAN